MSDAITPDELDAIARSLTDTEDLWSEAQRQTMPSVACDECGGSGNVDRGTLGGGCWKCHGVGVLADDFADRPVLELPAPLKSLRLEYKKVRGLLHAHEVATVAATNAIALELEPPPIPPPPTAKDAAALLAGVKKLDEIKQGARDAVRAHRAEVAQQQFEAPSRKALGKPAASRGGLSAGSLGAVDDADLDGEG